MTFQEFLSEIKGSTLPQLLEKSARRYEDLPFLCRFKNEKTTGYAFREVYQTAFRPAAGLTKLSIGKGDQVGFRRLSDQLADYKRVQHIPFRREEFEKTYTRKIKRHLFASPVRGNSRISIPTKHPTL